MRATENLHRSSDSKDEKVIVIYVLGEQTKVTLVCRCESDQGNKVIVQRIQETE